MALLTRPLLLALFVLGCGRTLRPQAPIDVTRDPLQSARTRPLPERLQGKFSFTIRSESNDIAGSTGGVILLDRTTTPPRGHLAALGPLGGPLATLQTSAGGASVAIARSRQHLVALNAEHVLRENTSGIVGLDDLMGLFVGDLPLDDAPVLNSRATDEQFEVLLDGPEQTTLFVALDPISATPRQLVAKDADGRVMLDVSYAPFSLQEVPRAAMGEGIAGDAETVAVSLPTDLSVRLPGLDLDLEVHMKSWSTPDTLPELFGLHAPDGFVTGSLEEAVRQWTLRALDATRHARPDTMGGAEEGG